jgi:hypothetical protein
MGGAVADTKPTDLYYENLGGINIKASEYSTGKAQFLSLYNLDFDVPNSLQKRPGSTQAVTSGTSGPIQSLFEFIKLDGTSYIIAASDTALFYIAAQQYTLLSSGWNNGQPPDMLTFVNKLWVANGQNFQSWNGTTALPVGLPCSNQGSTTNPLVITQFSGGTSFYLLGGATVGLVTSSGITFTARGVFFAYSFLRTDGYMGPVDLSLAQNLITDKAPVTEGAEFFSATYANKLFGFTVPPNKGITAVALWVGVDTIDKNSDYEFIPELGTNSLVGDLGYLFNPAPIGGNLAYLGAGLKPNADLSRFWLYTLLPVTSLFPAYTSALGATAYAFTLAGFHFNSFTGVASSAKAFSGVPFCYFDTNTPKYIEINQNIMFQAGFSSTPSTVWFSEVGAPETILPESSFEVRTNDGDRVLGLKAFQNQLLVFKETSFHKLLGNSADNFELVQISSEFGCLSNRAIVTYDTDIMWLDRKGIINYNGASWDVISTPIESVFRRMNLSVAREKACAVNHIYRNQIWFGIPVDGSTQNNLTIVYDYLLKAWTYFDGFNPASFAYVKGQLNVPTVWRGDYSGLIHYHGSSFFSDSGRSITCLALTRFENFGGQNETSIWRRFFLDVATASGVTGQIKGQVFSNYDHSTVQTTFAVYQDQFQTRAEMGVVGKAVAAQVSHSSASLPLLINGYAWTKRPLRNV